MTDANHSTDDKNNSSSESSTEQFVSGEDQDSVSALSNKSNNDDVTETTNTLSIIKSPNNTFVENNDNSVNILNKSSIENNRNNNPILKSDLPLLYINSTNTNQLKLYSNTPYTSLKSDASDASDASNATKPSQNQKTKAEQVGLPEIPCTFCDYKDPIEFDLSLHYLEKHRQNLIRLPIGKGSIDKRADYAVELSKKRLAESFDDDDDDRDDDEDKNESDE
jgi:hypothetical protein